MNIKVKTTLIQNFDSSLATAWMSDILNQYFDVRFYQDDVTYPDLASTIVFVDPVRCPEIFNKFSNSRATMIIDGLWERKDYISQEIRQKHFVLDNVNWFWYNESLCYKHWNLHTYQPNRTYQYRALMPLKLRRSHRDVLQHRMMPYLDDFVWSYVAQGRHLPNDSTAEPTNDRYFNSEWYDSTCFSLVSETCVESIDYHPIFITEKTVIEPIGCKII